MRDHHTIDQASRVCVLGGGGGGGGGGHVHAVNV